MRIQMAVASTLHLRAAPRPALCPKRSTTPCGATRSTQRSELVERSRITMGSVEAKPRSSDKSSVSAATLRVHRTGLAARELPCGGERNPSIHHDERSVIDRIANAARAARYL